MTQKHGQKPIRRWALKRFARDESGTTAIEFAMIAAPFLGLIFAIVETALVFFAGQVLDNGVAQASRLIRTGQAQGAGMTLTNFRSQLCSSVNMLFDCNKLVIDVSTLNNFGAPPGPPVGPGGNLNQGAGGFAPGAASDIVLVRVYYEWPTFVRTFGLDMANRPNGKHLLTGITTFRNEPF